VVDFDISFMLARVRLPFDQRFPCYRLLMAGLNTAVLMRFDLGVATDTALGGVSGTYKDCPIELRNWGDEDEDTIGLIDGEGFPESGQQNEILRWYLGLLKALLQQPLPVSEGDLAPGEWLRFDPDDPATPGRIVSAICAAVTIHEDIVFAQEFQRRLFSNLESGASLYLAALSRQDVMRMFRMPPLEPAE
jgi:hypothetical protein